MTPPTRKMRIDSLPRLPRCREPGTHREFNHGHTVLRESQRAWSRFSGIKRDLNIPTWYAGVHGVPDSLLRKRCSQMTEKEKALALLVRMNYILDFPHLSGVASHISFFCLPARRIRSFVRSCGPIYENGSYCTKVCNIRVNTSYALSTNYSWKGALACTLRNFVHLLSALLQPARLLQSLSSSLPESTLE